MNTHEDKGGVQVFVFLLEFPIVFVHFSLERVVELDSGVNPSFDTSEHRLQGIAEGLFQSFVI